MSTAVTGQLVQAIGWALDETPVDKDVKAGWTAFIIFLLLIAAVVVLAFSLVKQLRKTEAARKAGVFGPTKDATQDDSATTEAADAGPEPRQAP
jgi:4-hydroxybenzoate polyprenyltransferase